MANGRTGFDGVRQDICERSAQRARRLVPSHQHQRAGLHSRGRSGFCGSSASSRPTSQRTTSCVARSRSHLFYGLEMRDTVIKRVGLDGVARYSSDWPEQSECPFADAPSGALYQKVPQPDGTTEFVQLTCEDHLRLVADGLHRGEWSHVPLARLSGSYHAECDDNNGGLHAL